MLTTPPQWRGWEWVELYLYSPICLHSVDRDGYYSYIGLITYIPDIRILSWFLYKSLIFIANSVCICFRLHFCSNAGQGYMQQYWPCWLSCDPLTGKWLELIIIILIYLSVRFFNVCRRLPETKRHSSLFLHWINCNWVVTRWQWLFYMYTIYEIGY